MVGESGLWYWGSWAFGPVWNSNCGHGWKHWKHKFPNLPLSFGLTISIELLCPLDSPGGFAWAVSAQGRPGFIVFAWTGAGRTSSGTGDAPASSYPTSAITAADRMLARNSWGTRRASVRGSLKRLGMGDMRAFESPRLVISDSSSGTEVGSDCEIINV